MRHTVVWAESALNSLARLWATSSDRQSITDAVAEVDRLLRDDPELQGEDYYGDRLIVVEPLWVTYMVREADRIVEVADIWHR